jgi:hypothetical protein
LDGNVEAYSGTEANPTFLIGQFTGTNYDDGQTGILTIQSASPVPVPAAYTMFAAGLFGLGLVRKKAV